MRTPLLLAATASAAFLLSGCGTVISRPLQKVKVESRPAGAEVRADGLTKGTTPTVVELSRWEDHDITIELRGYRPYHVHLSRRVNPWIAGNIMNGFIVGVIVDASTGAIYKLDPPDVQADLFPRGVRRSAPAHGHEHGHATAKPKRGEGQVLISTTLKAEPHWKKVGQMERL
jgi:uncharacterized protein YceK